MITTFKSLPQAALLLALAVLAPSLALAEYSLFNPTPVEKLGEIVTDRPDRTESPISVEPGHFQHETDIVNMTFDHDGDLYGGFFMAPNVKLGLTESSDIQIVVSSYNYESSRGDENSKNVRRKVGGFGDLVIRYKQNIFGNNGEGDALAVMPYIKAPTARSGLGNGSLEGGIMLPYILELCDGFLIGAMTQVDFLRKDAGDGYRPNLINSATTSFNVTNSVAMYTEIFTSVGPKALPEHTFDVGFVYLLDKFTQFDIGVNFGLNDAAPDLNPFIGLSQKF